MRNLSGLRNGGEVKGKKSNRKVQYGIEKSDQNRTRQNKTGRERRNAAESITWARSLR
jgi:hypothetical protein